jgi:hypothetical protein
LGEIGGKTTENVPYWTNLPLLMMTVLIEVFRNNGRKTSNFSGGKFSLIKPD